MTTVPNKIIVAPFPPKEKTISGIIVPDTAKVRPDKATVICTGSNTGLKEGDIVYHVKGAGEPIIEGGVIYYVLHKAQLLAHISKA